MLHRYFNYLIKNQVIFALFLVVAGWLVIQLRDILLLVFLSYIIMSSMLPFVAYLRKKQFPKIFSVVIPYFIMLTIILLIIVPLVPFVVSQIQSLVAGFPVYLKQALETFGWSIDSKQIQGYLADELNLWGRNAILLTTQVFGGLFSFLAIFIISFYLLMYYDEFKRLFARLFPADMRPNVLTTVDTINQKLGMWLRGELILILFIGLMSLVALTILRVPYSLPLAILAGILEIVPTLGPTLSAIPAVIVALTVSPTLAITIILVYVVIQLIENNFLVPKVMEKAVGLNPVVIIIGVLIGTNLMGIAGGLLAIPLISFVLIIITALFRRQAASREKDS